MVLAAAHVDRPGRSTRHAHVQVVRRGESLWSIARRHGMNVNTLAAMNGMHPGDALRAGQHIKLTSAESTAPTHKARRMTYTVREGDTVAQIARLFQCSVPDLLGLERHEFGHAPARRPEAAHSPGDPPGLTYRPVRGQRSACGLFPA